MQHTHRGYSLIEIMVSVAIIGILTGLALPSYKDYLIKTRVTELLAFASLAKVAMAESLCFGVSPDTITTESLGFTELPEQSMAKILIVQPPPNLAVVVKGRHERLGLDKPEDDNAILTIGLYPNVQPGGITWICKTTPSNFYRYVPLNCRNN